MRLHFFLLSSIILVLTACQQKQEYQQSVMFASEKTAADSTGLYDLEDIEEMGTLIAGTLSGPDTYYEYHGRELGIQFMLAEEFAQSIGTKLQMEIAPDTASLMQKLNNGEIDFIALEIPCWKTRDNAPQLREAIEQWWTPERKEKLLQTIAKQRTGTPIRRKMRPLMLDAKGGVISQFDGMFKHHAQSVGLDWRLVAAVSFQESGFDPQATSWIGAKGLMQLMPSTAQGLGIDLNKIYDPNTNIEGGCKVLKRAYSTFKDIPDPQERIRFALAGYNGGCNHIRDAMALCLKYGGNNKVWSQVAHYVLLLEKQEYYRDPVVKYGYMRGSETETYVTRVTNRWQEYCSKVRGGGQGVNTPAPARKSMQQGKYKSQVKSADEWVPDTTSVKVF